MGGLLRLIVLGIIIWFAYQAIQRFLGNMKTQQNGAPPPSPANTAGQIMRPCAQCGVHIPEGESSQSRGYFFCCEAHRDAFFRNNAR